MLRHVGITFEGIKQWQIYYAHGDVEREEKPNSKDAHQIILEKLKVATRRSKVTTDSTLKQREKR